MTEVEVIYSLKSEKVLLNCKIIRNNEAEEQKLSTVKKSNYRNTTSFEVIALFYDLMLH